MRMGSRRIKLNKCYELFISKYFSVLPDTVMTYTEIACSFKKWYKWIKARISVSLKMIVWILKDYFRVDWNFIPWSQIWGTAIGIPFWRGKLVCLCTFRVLGSLPGGGAKETGMHSWFTTLWAKFASTDAPKFNYEQSEYVNKSGNNRKSKWLQEKKRTLRTGSQF